MDIPKYVRRCVLAACASPKAFVHASSLDRISLDKDPTVGVCILFRVLETDVDIRLLLQARMPIGMLECSQFVCFLQV